jgi:hypothetical protein
MSGQGMGEGGGQWAPLAFVQTGEQAARQNIVLDRLQGELLASI